jgi:hypothetical protein
LSWRDISIADPNDRMYLNATTSMGRFSSDTNWEWYDKIGEVRYGISRSARIAGYARLRAERVGRDGQVDDVRDSGVVADIVDGIYSRFGGTRGLIERFYHLMKLPAEGYLIRVRDRPELDPDGYFFLSPSEIDPTSTSQIEPSRAGPIKWVTARMASSNGDGQQFIREVQPADFLGRIWNPSKRWVDMTDSPMTALHTECQALHLLTENIIGRLKQRFALAGILLIPSEINDAQIAGPTPNSVHHDKVMNYLISVMTRNVTDHADAMGQVPIVMKGPANVLEAVRHLIFDASVSDADIKLRSELVGRILDGLDVQKQATKGGEETSHWGMWAVSDEERRITVQPDMETMCFALTRAILWPELRKREWNAARIRPWRVGFELSTAAVKSNMAEDMRQAWDRGWVNATAGRRTIGANESDAMTNEEYVRWVGQKMDDPYLALFGLQGIEVDWSKVKASGGTPGPNPDSPGDDVPVGPGVGQPGSPDDRDSDAPKSEEPG